MPAGHLRHDHARRKRFRDDPPLVRVTPPSPATNATANLDAPSRRGSVNYMVDHICEPMPSTVRIFRICRSLQDGSKTPRDATAGRFGKMAAHTGVDTGRMPGMPAAASGDTERFVRHGAVEGTNGLIGQ